MTRVLVIAVTIALSLFATRASALTLGDEFYLGHIVNASPASEAAELTYVNSLLDLSNGAAPTPCSLAPSEDCDRLSSTIDASLFSDAKLDGALKDDSSNNLIDVTGFQYLLAKYGGNAFVWRVDGLVGIQEIPTNLGACGNSAGGCGLSHSTLFHNPVPDGGATLSLLGISLLGLCVVARKTKSNL